MWSGEQHPSAEQEAIAKRAVSNPGVAGSAAVEQSPSVLGEATLRMRTLLKRLSVVATEHKRRMDILVGPVPEDPTALQEVPSEQSELGKLFGALDDMEMMVNAVENELSRLQVLAG